MNLSKLRWLRWLLVVAALLVVGAACEAAPPGQPSTTSSTTTSTMPSGPWVVTVKVGVADYMVTKYGATQLRAKIDQQLNEVNAVYGVKFATKINFVVNEYYTYIPSIGPDGKLSSDNERTVPHPSSDLLLLYSENTIKDDGGWVPQTTSVGIRWTDAYGGVFGPYGTTSVIHEFGHALGAIDLYGLDVDTNPINGQTYRSPTSYMEVQWEASDFDPYSRSVINVTARERKVNTDDHVVRTSTPANYQVQVKTSSGAAVKSAAVALYPVDWFSRAVTATPAFTGVTNTSGVYALPSNPFDPSPMWVKWGIKWPNFLVKVTSGNATSYGWLTLNDAGNAFFAGQSTYTLDVTVG